MSASTTRVILRHGLVAELHGDLDALADALTAEPEPPPLRSKDALPPGGNISRRSRGRRSWTFNGHYWEDCSCADCTSRRAGTHAHCAHGLRADCKHCRPAS